jgi:hypothetical protein
MDAQVVDEKMLLWLMTCGGDIIELSVPTITCNCSEVAQE